MGLTGLKERTALAREGLKALIEREAAQCVARLGGSYPQISLPAKMRGTTNRLQRRPGTQRCRRGLDVGVGSRRPLRCLRPGARRAARVALGRDRAGGRRWRCWSRAVGAVARRGLAGSPLAAGGASLRSAAFGFGRWA